MLYLARLQRCIGYVIALFGFYSLTAVLAANGIWVKGIDFYLVFNAVTFLWWVTGVVDAYLLARKLPPEFPTPWYSTWIGILGLFVIWTFFSAGIRAFVFEPYRMPSSSMLPTLRLADVVLVNKFVYGLRLPALNKTMIDGRDPRRGEIIVFKYPKEMSLTYIKRVVGVPNDKIVYKNKQLTVNGKQVTYDVLPDYMDEQRLVYYRHFRENLAGAAHVIIIDNNAPAGVPSPDRFPMDELCDYDAAGFECTVPAGHYFVMGDNRDNSLDSRYWGFVPDRNIVGKLMTKWPNFNE